MKKLIILIAISFTLFSCEKLSELNENPNNITETHPSMLLTQVITNIGKVQNRSALEATRVLIYTGGESENQYYKWSRDNGTFSDNFNILRQVQKMADEAERLENKSYVAISKVLRAILFYDLTLRYGDIPYSEALKGESEGIYTPKYDAQEDVFSGILRELEEANNDFRDNGNGIVFSEPFYGGDVAKWRKLANSLRLKILLTLSKKSNVGGIDIKSTFSQIANNEPIFESFDEGAMLNFFNQDGSRYTRFNDSGFGSDVYFCDFFIDALAAKKDPRLFVFAEPTLGASEKGMGVGDFEAYGGGSATKPYSEVKKLASEGKLSRVNSRYYTSPTTEASVVLGYSELQFILAEAAARGWISGNASTYYKEGILSNFEFYGKYAPDYASFFGSDSYAKYTAQSSLQLSGELESDLQKIIEQRYFASFFQGDWDTYYNYLRTGYPKLPINGSNAAPKRWMYPNNEFNTNNANLEKALQSQFGGNDGTRETPWWLK